VERHEVAEARKPSKVRTILNAAFAFLGLVTLLLAVAAGLGATLRGSPLAQHLGVAVILVMSLTFVICLWGIWGGLYFLVRLISMLEQPQPSDYV